MALTRVCDYCSQTAHVNLDEGPNRLAMLTLELRNQRQIHRAVCPSCLNRAFTEWNKLREQPYVSSQCSISDCGMVCPCPYVIDRNVNKRICTGCYVTNMAKRPDQDRGSWCFCCARYVTRAATSDRSTICQIIALVVPKTKALPSVGDIACESCHRRYLSGDMRTSMTTSSTVLSAAAASALARSNEFPLSVTTGALPVDQLDVTRTMQIVDPPRPVPKQPALTVSMMSEMLSRGDNSPDSHLRSPPRKAVNIRENPAPRPAYAQRCSTCQSVNNLVAIVPHTWAFTLQSITCYTCLQETLSTRSSAPVVPPGIPDAQIPSRQILPVAVDASPPRVALSGPISKRTRELVESERKYQIREQEIKCCSPLMAGVDDVSTDSSDISPVARVAAPTHYVPPIKPPLSIEKVAGTVDDVPIVLTMRSRQKCFICDKDEATRKSGSRGQWMGKPYNADVSICDQCHVNITHCIICKSDKNLLTTRAHKWHGNNLIPACSVICGNCNKAIRHKS